MFRRLFKHRLLRRGFTGQGEKFNNGAHEITQTGAMRHFASTVSSTPKEWDLIVGVCLERHPVISKPMNEMEQKFSEYIKKKELENSLKSDFEVYYDNAKSKQQIDLSNLELEKYDTRYIVELEGSSLDEFNKFKLAPRETDDTVTSVKRRLDKNLILLVEQQLGNEKYWIPPQSYRKDEESLRETAERILNEFCGSNLVATIYGNAPFGCYKYSYPKTLREKGRYGAKIFYYLAKYNKGGISAPVNYQWLDRQELKEKLPAGIHKSISKFLIPE